MSEFQQDQPWAYDRGATVSIANVKIHRKHLIRSTSSVALVQGLQGWSAWVEIALPAHQNRCALMNKIIHRANKGGCDEAKLPPGAASPPPNCNYVKSTAGGHVNADPKTLAISKKHFHNLRHGVTTNNLSILCILLVAEVTICDV